MGWASGSGLAEEVWNAVKEFIPKKKKAAVAREIIGSFESMDCDTMQECTEMWNAAYVRCSCYDKETGDFNEHCTKCDGLGWVDRK
jgi:hypothetical protein